MAVTTFFVTINFIIISNSVQAFNIYSETDYTPKNAEDISRPCLQQYNASDLMTLLQFFDASVKIPVGIGNGNFFHLGNYDECYNLESKTEMGTIYGKYCLGTIPVANLVSQKRFPFNKLPIEPRMLGSNTDTLGIHLAYCVPNACTAEDIEKMTVGIVKFDEAFCQSKTTEPELTNGAIATIIILAIFLAVIVVSTVYDVSLYYLEKTPLHELLLSFSIFTNGKKLLSASTNPDQLLCLNGIKALSMVWVILGHMYTHAMTSAPGNYFDLMTFQKDAANMFLIGATVSVDSFLAVGGLVTVYTFLKAADKKVKFNIFMYYVHRYLRLTPALAIIILIHANLLQFMGKGPLWNTTTDLSRSCQKNWWSTLIYIQNYYNFDNEMCVPQSWYLAVDFQIFLLSPFVLLPLKWKPKIGLAILGLLIAAGAVIPFVIGFVYKIYGYVSIESSLEETTNMMKMYYIKTHTRFGPYVIGMLAGYFISKLKKSATKINLHPILSVGIWLTTLTGLVACVYSYHDHMEYDRWSHSLSLAFLRNAWGVCVCTVVIMCVSGSGGIVDWFLSLPAFQFLTKLSYSMYLTHYALIKMRFASVKYSFEFSNGFMFWSFWGDFMLTLGVSLVLCLAFESPVVILEKHIFKSGGTAKATTAETKVEKG